MDDCLIYLQPQKEWFTTPYKSVYSDTIFSSIMTSYFLPAFQEKPPCHGAKGKLTIQLNSNPFNSLTICKCLCFTSDKITTPIRNNITRTT